MRRVADSGIKIVVSEAFLRNQRRDSNPRHADYDRTAAYPWSACCYGF